MIDLAGLHPARYSGITVSGVQARMAAERIRRCGAEKVCRIRLGDYLEESAFVGLPERSDGSFDAVYAIESFVHAADPDRLLALVSERIRPGGLLLLCDDVLARDEAELSSADRKLIETFRAGWGTPSLLPREILRRKAEQAGFELAGADDLTPYLDLRRPRDRLIGLALRIRGIGRSRRGEGPDGSAFWRNLSGGDALQRAIGRGIIRYVLFRFRRISNGGENHERV